MDKAFWGTMRWGYFRWGMYNPIWDNEILPKLLNISASTKGGITPCIQGAACQGQTRQGVYIPLWDEVKTELEKAQ